MNEQVKEILGVLNDDPSGFLYIVSLANVLTIACGLIQRIWQSTPFRFLLCAQLLMLPIITVIALFFAIHPVVP